MKRLNIHTKQPFQRGDIREDGKLFFRYALGRLNKTGYFLEIWLTKEKHDKKLLESNLWSKNKLKNEEFRKIHNERTKSWRLKNPKKQRELIVNWNQSNQPKLRSYLAKRKASQKQRTPEWANFKKIEEFYDAADFLGMVTGEWHEVDHIVPLQGKNVSGLHVENNLQVLSRKENRSKKNTFLIGE
jgi:hypothetical protein